MKTLREFWVDLVFILLLVLVSMCMTNCVWWLTQPTLTEAQAKDPRMQAFHNCKIYMMNQKFNDSVMMNLGVMEGSYVNSNFDKNVLLLNGCPPHIVDMEARRVQTIDTQVTPTRELTNASDRAPTSAPTVKKLPEEE